MKHIIWFVVAIIMSVIIVVGYHVKPYYTPAEKQYGLNIARHNDDTIRIAYIGDSWADRHRFVNCVIDSMISIHTGRHASVRFAGISGITSKNVYYGIFRDDYMRSVIEWGPNYCFVIAGINDSDRKMGLGYYKENMRLIIDLLLSNQITPIIIEIPYYDIRYSFKRKPIKIKVLYLLSMLVTWSKMDCIEDYKEAYKDLLLEQKWGDKIITIFSQDWNPNGCNDERDLYEEDLIHLNSRGYYVLDTCIANKIVNHLRCK